MTDNARKHEIVHEYEVYKRMQWDLYESVPPHFTDWLLERLVTLEDERDTLLDGFNKSEIERRKDEDDYAKLCHAVVGANCHVDHAIETLTEQRKAQKVMHDALTAIAYGTELAWLKSNPNVRTTFDSSGRRVSAIALAYAAGLREVFE